MRAYHIADFNSECEVTINRLDPELAYQPAELDGFVRGCWPTDDSPADIAAAFAESLAAHRVSRPAGRAAFEHP